MAQHFADELFEGCSRSHNKGESELLAAQGVWDAVEKLLASISLVAPQTPCRIVEAPS